MSWLRARTRQASFFSLAELADLRVGFGGVAEDESLLGNAGAGIGDGQGSVGPADGGVTVLVEGVRDELAQPPHRDTYLRLSSRFAGQIADERSGM